VLSPYLIPVMFSGDADLALVFPRVFYGPNIVLIVLMLESTDQVLYIDVRWMCWQHSTWELQRYNRAVLFICRIFCWKTNSGCKVPYKQQHAATDTVD